MFIIIFLNEQKFYGYTKINVKYPLLCKYHYIQDLFIIIKDSMFIIENISHLNILCLKIMKAYYQRFELELAYNIIFIVQGELIKKIYYKIQTCLLLKLSEFMKYLERTRLL